MKIEKIIKITVCFVFMCTVLFASAIAGADPYLTAKTEMTDTGCVVKIGIEGNVGISTFKLKIGYDKGTPKKIEAGEILTGGMLETSIESEDFAADSGEFNVVYVGTKNITDNGNLFSVYFECENGEIPSVTVESEKNGVINEKFENITLKSAVSKNDENKSETGGFVSGGSSGGVKAPVAVTESKTETEQQAEAKISFRDIADGAWYKEAVVFMSENGYMNGTSEDTFAPDESLSRAMLVTVLWRVSGQPESEKAPFLDVKQDSWYEKAVNWAYTNKIVTGVDDRNFAPKDKITREQIATIIYRYAKTKEIGKTYAGEKISYVDEGEISDYAKNAVIWCSEVSLMNGKGNNTFTPKDNATRAETATVLMRFVKLI